MRSGFARLHGIALTSDMSLVDYENAAHLVDRFHKEWSECKVGEILTTKLRAILHMANRSLEKGLPFEPDNVTGKDLCRHVAHLKNGSKICERGSRDDTAMASTTRGLGEDEQYNPRPSSHAESGQAGMKEVLWMCGMGGVARRFS